MKFGKHCIALAAFAISAPFAYPCFSQEASLGSKGSLSGTIFCSDTGKVARFATVHIAGVSSQHQVYASEATDSNGYFEIKGLPPGDYSISGSYPGYLDMNDQRLPATAIHNQLAKTSLVNIAEGRQVSVNVTLTRGEVLSGVVSYADGSKGEGLRVFALWAESGSSNGTSITSAYTDDQGTYRLSGLPPGKYLIKVEIPSSTLEWYFGDTSQKAAAHVVDDFVGEEEGIDLRLPSSLAAR